FLRRTRINKYLRTLEGIRRKYELVKINRAITVALNGDGNSNPALNVDAAGTAWSFSDFDNLIAEGNDYDITPTVFIADKAEMLNIVAMRYPQANLQLTPQQVAMFEGRGYRTPNGDAIMFAPSGSVLSGSRKLLGWVPQLGLERVIEEGSIIQEATRYIEDQTQAIVISEVESYAKPEKFGTWTLTRQAA
ncbi:MAG: hypothetical protein AAF267_16880, partial [Deinococcota bacterium]